LVFYMDYIRVLLNLTGNILEKNTWQFDYSGTVGTEYFLLLC
jgi:hypothetical protein